MAVNNEATSVNALTLTIEDQTATPNTFAVPLVLGSLTPPMHDKERAKSELFQNSATGASRYALVPLGKAEGQTFTCQHWLSDEENDTDQNAASLFRALQKNSVSGTGFSGWNVGSNLTGGGGAEVVASVGMRSNEGTDITVKIPVEVQDYTRTTVNEALAGEVTFLVVGTFTRT